MLKPQKLAGFLLSFRQIFEWKHESMKPNLSRKAMKFTEELVDISWVEFKLFISNWKRFDPLLKPIKGLFYVKNGLVDQRHKSDKWS